MTSLTPLAAYQQALQKQDYQLDPAQYQAVEQLDKLYQQLQLHHAAAGSNRKSHWWRCWQKKKTASPLRGLYLWGGVGRGKTWLMDLFYQNLPGSRKIRLHFHRFMQKVHDQLTGLEGIKNPLESIADEFAAHADILCFDEFFVTDIADAMLLGELLKCLFARGVTLVTTSNLPPDQLYHNGLQRARFLPAIAIIEQQCQIINVDSGIDYRRQTLTEKNIFIIGEQKEARMEQLFFALTGGKGEGKQILQLNQRAFTVLNRWEGALVIAFGELCEQPRSARDYIVLASEYHTLFLHNVPIMGGAAIGEDKSENSARRFIALIDEFYERRVKLIISAAAEPAQLYHGKPSHFEFQRCLSRLYEMQSRHYLDQPHKP